MSLTIEHIRQAQERIQPYIHRTDITSMKLPYGGTLRIKAENLQITGAFKVRGAFSKLLLLNEEEKRHGVLASSAGNHAQGVALAAQTIGTPCTIVMPRTAPLSKIAATEAYGAKVVLAGDVYDDAYAHALELQKKTGATFIHPFDDPAVIAGQGTIGLEILEQYPDVEQVLVPIGGGGLIAGVALAVKSLAPHVKVIGVEPRGAASMSASINAGQIVTLPSVQTMADGIAVKTPGKLTYELCSQYVDQIVTVDDDDLATTILFLLEKAKIVSEGAGAASVAAALCNKIPTVKNTVALLSGGNIDVTLVSRIIDKGLVLAGRKAILKTMISDKPGQLSKMLSLVAQSGANIVRVNHDRLQIKTPLSMTVVELELETRDRAHVSEIESLLKQHGYFILQ
jgi:threonine dehydratase